MKKQLNFVNSLNNRVRKRYYIDNNSEFDLVPREENNQVYSINDNQLFQMEVANEEEEISDNIVSFMGRQKTKIEKLQVNIEPVQSGTGDPSPDNVRPISGWDAMDILQLSQNIMNGVPYVANSYYNDNGGISSSAKTKRIALYLPVTPGKPYVLGWQGYAPTVRVRVHEYAADQTWLRQIYSDYSSVATWTASEDAAFIRFSLPTVAENVVLGEGVRYPIDLGQTVYGGTLDVINGRVLITMEMFSPESVDNAAKSSDGSGDRYGYVRIGPMGYIKTDGNQICNMLQRANVTIGKMPAGFFKVINSTGGNEARAAFHFAGLTSLEEYNEKLQQLKSANTPLQICFELEEPIEIQLTPAEITSLIGQNTIWSDAGPITLKYSTKGLTTYLLKP